MANLKIVTGKLAIGSFRSVLQNWLDSEVNSSGALFHPQYAIANNTPVIIPDTEAF